PRESSHCRERRSSSTQPRNRAWGRIVGERGWRHLRLLSSKGNPVGLPEPAGVGGLGYCPVCQAAFGRATKVTLRTRRFEFLAECPLHRSIKAAATRPRG